MSTEISESAGDAPSAAGIEFEPLTGPFGATVRGLDLRRPLAREDFLRIARGLRDHHLLVVEGQQLEKAQYLAFGRQWGEPITFFHPSHREQEFPQLITIHNRPDTPAEQRNAALHWHVDSSYEAPPAAVTMLYAVEAPASGNETLFVDMIAAYDALPDETKAEIEGLVVKHGLGDPRLNLEGEYRGRNKEVIEARQRLAIYHPLVFPHPLTGRKALYSPSGSAFGVVGMEDEAAIALLRRLKQQAVQPRFIQRAAARTGSIVIWDNYAVMHSATPTRYADGDGERRLLYRISTRDVVLV